MRNASDQLPTTKLSDGLLASLETAGSNLAEKLYVRFPALFLLVFLHVPYFSQREFSLTLLVLIELLILINLFVDSSQQDSLELYSRGDEEHAPLADLSLLRNIVRIIIRTLDLSHVNLSPDK